MVFLLNSLSVCYTFGVFRTNREKCCMGKDEIKDRLLKNSNIADKYKVKSLYLFGSYARGEATKESDIDLLVEFEEPTFRNYIGCLREYEELLGQKVDLVCRDSLKEKIRPFILEEAEEVL
jgi:uncharacterized protein